MRTGSFFMNSRFLKSYYILIVIKPITFKNVSRKVISPGILYGFFIVLGARNKVKKIKKNCIHGGAERRTTYVTDKR